ncbi:MAG: glucosyltransferase domain-containing protein [Clostridia bacterium]|nr:glucosyltransferase domain-containing protein [Clostridia bacterium]
MKLKDIKLGVGLFIFTCVILLSYIVKHFSNDTFMIVRYGYQGYAINYSFLDGRVFMGCISLIAEKLKLPIFTYNRILMILAIIVSVIAVIKLKNIVLKYKKVESKTGKALLIIACYYTIFHFFHIVNLYFAEGFVMSLSVLFYIIAADIMVDNKRYFKTFVFLLLGIFSYQATISMFFISVILFSMLKEESLKEIIINFIKAIIFALIVIGINYCEILIVQKVFGIEQERITGTLFENITLCLYNIWEVLVFTADKFPKYLFLAFILIIEVLVQYNTFRYNKNKKGERFLIEQIFLVVFGIAVSFIPSILTLTAFFSGRLRFSMGATIGILFIHIITKSDFVNNKKIGSKLLICVLIVYAITNSVNYVYLTLLNQKTNELDVRDVYVLDEYISEYEKENNIKVTKIAVMLEANDMGKFHDEVKTKRNSFAISTLRVEWSVDGFINYYTGRNLERLTRTYEMIELYVENLDQTRHYTCIGDTLYISVYHF